MNIDDLRDQLAELAGPEARPTAQARDAVQARVRRTRRRQRATGVLSTVLAAALVVGIIGLGLNGKDDGVQVRTTSPTTTAAEPQCRLGVKAVPRNQVPAAVEAWNDGRAVVGGGALWTGLAILKQPPIHDGSIYRFKIGWYAIPFGIPKITARRLDGPARATGHGNEAIDQHGKWVASTIEFPSAGCWEITARLDNSVITFRRLIGSPPLPLAIGTITGTLEQVGLAANAPQPVAGTVEVTPIRTTGENSGVRVCAEPLPATACPAPVASVTTADGRFRLDVPVGAYSMSGTARVAVGPAGNCGLASVVTVARGQTTDVSVICPIR